ncbi:tetratricopeptide repeat protein [Labedella gwakjiensis]|uniref:AAA family ATPase n=1 Tax=Labedella gwakjiensis TaxID=390269 RepID=A0A2P8GV53_9MICO|nr:AAA family ATPase [Labedella gwakjiensis]PSL37850.1 tetratricopeptide repeat protein [Labedella gwakjiensis]RUQ87578.1 AAA family ATPase [Labedella gwakjiensis]
MSDPLFDSLFAALEASPDNVELRVQVARLLLERGRLDDAVTQAATALAQAPGNAEAMAVLTEATTAMRRGGRHAQPARDDRETDTTPDDSISEVRDEFSNGDREQPITRPNDVQHPSDEEHPDGFDWKRAESELGESAVPPPYVASSPEPEASAQDAVLPITPGGDTVTPVVDEYQSTVTLADVGGLETVKQRLRESFLEPMKHPELAKAFGKNLRGGLVLYGPPGCGKTFMARAIAGELGARFLTASLADILGSHFGETEKNLRALFEHARSLTPAVLFLDEIDAIGAKRSSIGTGWSGMRAMVDQLLMELDSMTADNDGLFVLAATNSPWEVDPALMRPGRFDRMLLVLPPDEPAREAILRMHLDRRPIEGIDLGELVRSTDGFSGADLEHLVASAAEQAMIRSIQSGEVKPIGMNELRHVLGEIRPSTGPWLAGAKNVVAFANTDGRYDDLAEFLDSRGYR